MRDAMSVFKELAASVMVPIVLLFTKKDVFEENLKIQPFSDFFPEYTGAMDSASIRNYLASWFRDLDERPWGELYCYFINAVDPDNVKEVFEEIELNIFKARPTTNPHYKLTSPGCIVAGE